MTSEKILVFAPHPDDEIIGCGGYLAQSQLNGAAIKIVVISDGLLGLTPDQQQMRPIRYQESRAGLSILGIFDVCFWNYRDGAIPLSSQIILDYQQVVLAFKPTRILLPAPGESHPDHRRVTRGVIKALQGKWTGDLWFYETTQVATHVNVIVDISDFIENKLQALAVHESQITQYDYIEHCTSLSRLRGLSAGYRHAESFMVFTWDGSIQNFFEARPLISVIIRSNDFGFLKNALASLVAQDYDHIEIVLVWFGELEPDLTSYAVLDINQVPGGANRSENLNIGLAHACGDYVAFLDQDDVFYPDHLALLLAEIQGRSDIDVVYSGCHVVDCQIKEGVVNIIKNVTTLNKPVESLCLFIANSIPNHALLFRSQLFRQVQFDKNLDAYEDWDLLAQLTLAGCRFAHLDEITCEYRLYSENGESKTLEQDHSLKGYPEWAEKVLEKIVSQLSASNLQQLSNIVSQSDQQKKLLEDRLNIAERQVTALKLKLQESNECLDFLRRSMPVLGIERSGLSGVSQLVGQSLKSNHLISIVVPVFNTAPDILSEAIGSIIRQNFSGWELCLVDDASTHPDTLAVLEAIKNKLFLSGKLRFKRRDNQGGIVAATNDALSLASGSYVAFMDHDDLLHEDALLEIALAVEYKPYKLLYTDSTLIDLAGRLMHVYHKPDWSPDTLRHMNFINHLTVVDSGILSSIGGFRASTDGSQDWDLLLRLEPCLEVEEVCHIRKPLYAWRAAEESVAYSAKSKPSAFKAGICVVADYLETKGLEKSTCFANPIGPGVAGDWASAVRSVDIIIPTHNNFEGLIKCLDGINSLTDYADFSVFVIANRCADQEMLQYLDMQSKKYGITIVKNDRPFNWALINNSVAFNSKADLLLFMNDDVEVTHSDWLSIMARQFDVDGIGIVGATLQYGNGELQHNGVHTDPQWVAENIKTTGCFNELRVNRNVAAVTGACMLVSRESFNCVDGFDERFAVNFNDVDFCLAVRQAGYRVIQVSNVSLIHHESISRGVLDSDEKKALLALEAQLMRDKWGEYLNDPFWARYDVYAYGTRILHVD